MSKIILCLCLLSSHLLFSCGGKNFAKPNEKALATWYFKDDEGSFVELSQSDYRQVVGRLNSEIKGKVGWTDSLNLELNITEVEGEIEKYISLRPGQLVHFKIVDVSPKQLRLEYRGQIWVLLRD